MIFNPSVIVLWFDEKNLGSGEVLLTSEEFIKGLDSLIEIKYPDYEVVDRRSPKGHGWCYGVFLKHKDASTDWDLNIISSRFFII